MDRVTLVDTKDRAIGTIEKMRAHESPMLHRAFSVFIFDPDGERMLLQKRALGKYHSGGLWTNACCSHPGEEETLVETAGKRLLEEMGIDCPLEAVGHFIYMHRFSEKLYEYEYDHILIGFSGSEPVPDPNEVEATAWLPVERLREELLLKPERFTPWFLTAAPIALEYLETKRDVLAKMSE